MAPDKYDVIVIGGGISGLVCALRLAQAGVRTLVMEKDAAPGGVIKTRRENGWLLDVGPNSLAIKEGDDAHSLVRELGLEDELLARPIRDSDRYVWRGGMLRRVPSSPVQLLRRSAVSRRTLTRASWGLIRRHSLPENDISIGAYFSHCLGRKAVDQLLSPALSGIYAADPFSLSLEAVMPRLHGAAKQSRSLAGAMRRMKRESQKPGGTVTGKRMLASFKNGMDVLPQRVLQKITEAGGDVAVNCAAENIGHAFEGGWVVSSSAGIQFEADHVVCALPSMAAADALQLTLPDVAAELRQIRYAPLVMVHVGVKEAEVDVAHQGFGFLATRDAGVRSLGMIWSDRMFEGRAPEGHRLFTIFMGGQIDPALVKVSDGEVLDLALRDLRRVMKWQGEAPDMARITRYNCAIPFLEVGHAARVRSVQQAMPPGLTLAGNYVSGVSVPSCIEAGNRLAAQLAPAVKSA